MSSPAQANKEQAIVDAAAKRFRYYGIGKTTMQEIAQDAGMAVGTLYLYFANKDALVAACVEKFAERHRQQAEEILSSKLPPNEKLRAYVIARFRQAEETRTSSPHAAEITRAVLRVKPDRIREEGQMMHAVVVQILSEGIESGMFCVADVHRDAMIFLYSLVAFFPNALSEPQIVPLETDLVSVVDWFLDTWKSGAHGRKGEKLTAGGRRRAKVRGKA
jgi:AcrR family transcriptional regulator